MSGELLLELLTEEIPARMQRGGLDQLKERIRDFLGNEFLESSEIRGYVTPRRLTIVATGIPQKQADFHEERRGPKVGAPEAARAGFARSAGISIEHLIERDGYYFAEITRVGRPTREVLSKAVTEAIIQTVWPKSMRFPVAPVHWVRPINSIICLFDGEIVPLSVGQVPVGRATRGHRFLSEGEIAVDNAADYLDKLERAYVVLDHDRRRAIIDEDLKKRAAADGLTVKPDPGLLDEVAGLVEFPVVLIGAIDDSSMELPPEVLATAMRTHQKYFSCLKPDGSPAPRFLFVANNLTADDGKTIVAGNERVLRARLADARFFWDQDRKIPLASRVAALKDRVYHAKLGSVFDKVQRMEALTDFLVPHVPSADAERARRAAWLAKADLSTGMVGEFPELQGVMGRYYALHDSEDPRVADAIADHYKPLGPNDTCPTTPDSIVVSLADKLDSLAAFFAINDKPTGSGDPFALRRAALGVIRIIIENDLRLPLRDVFFRALTGLGVADDSKAAVVDDLLSFVMDRFSVYLRNMGYGVGMIRAVSSRGRVVQVGANRSVTREDDVVRLARRIAIFQNFIGSEAGANLVVAYRRAANIVQIEEKRDGCSYDGAVLRAQLRQPEETELEARLRQVMQDETAALATEDFEGAMAALATLRRPVDEFFDKVTVNADDPALRENRLRLLSRIRAVMNQVADFSQIEG